MGEHNKRRTLDMLLLQLAIMDGEITEDEAVDVYMDKWFRDEAPRDDSWHIGHHAYVI